MEVIKTESWGCLAFPMRLWLFYRVFVTLDGLHRGRGSAMQPGEPVVRGMVIANSVVFRLLVLMNPFAPRNCGLCVNHLGRTEYCND